MNKDQATGALKDIGGKIQEGVGKVIGSKEQQKDGLKHQVEGKIQSIIGDTKEGIKDIKTAVTKSLNK
jgi:uncharacterized protein YjbJ (UPF0337 family)